MAVDLHIHSTMSDGTQTPEEIAAAAIEAGLYAISITDHEHVAGVAPARVAAGERLQVLAGVEIAGELHQREVHILGYLIDCENVALLAKLAEIRRSRDSRAREMVRRLNAAGVKLKYEDVSRIAGAGSIGRPHVARALLDEGIVSHQQEAFQRFLRAGRPAYVPRYKLEVTEVISLVREAGGAAVLAHPGLCNNDKLVREVIAVGIDGIEAYHTAHTDHQRDKYLDMAEEYRLLATGGSDSHGPGGSIPVAIGSVAVPDEIVEALLEWADTEHPTTGISR
jgi:3',5'-nucleoside bisphosphate phosphatase